MRQAELLGHRLSDRDGLRSRYLLFDRQALYRLSYTAKVGNRVGGFEPQPVYRRDGLRRPDLSRSRLTRSNDIPDADTVFTGRSPPPPCVTFMTATQV